MRINNHSAEIDAIQLGETIRIGDKIDGIPMISPDFDPFGEYPGHREFRERSRHLRHEGAKSILATAKQVGASTPPIENQMDIWKGPFKLRNVMLGPRPNRVIFERVECQIGAEFRKKVQHFENARVAAVTADHGIPKESRNNRPLSGMTQAALINIGHSHSLKSSEVTPTLLLRSN